MIKKHVPGRFKRAYWIFSRAASVLIASLGSYVMLGFASELSTQSKLSATGIIVSAILTFALIAVYRDIGQIQRQQADEMSEQRDLQEDVIDIQSQQRDIQSQQQELLRIEKLPEIEISSRSIDGDELEVVLSNYGHGIAKNVIFATSLHAAGNSKFEPVLMESRARRIDENGEKTLEQSVKPQESRITFRGKPSFSYRFEGREHRFADFSTAFRQLHQQGIDSIWFQIYVIVSDQLGGCQAKPLFWPARNAGDIAKHVDVTTEHVNLKTAYDLGGLINEDEKPEILTPDCRE